MKQQAKAASAGSTEAGGSRGLLRRAFATRTARGGSRGSGAPSLRRLRSALAALALAIAALAVIAAPASADTTRVVAISKVSYGSAHVKGKITTTGIFELYTVEYSTDGSSWTPGPGGFAFSPTEEFIEVDLTGLKGGTKYFVQITTSHGGVSPTPDPSFTTLTVEPPGITATNDASEVFSLSATASGKIKRPANADPAFDVNCRFEYVTDAQFTATGFEGATPVPCGQNPITAASVDGSGEEAVGAELANLSASTTYHLRLAAENGAPGVVTKEAAHTFTTAATVVKPTVLATANASAVEYTIAKASGEVERPAGADPALNINCNFEYVTDAQFAENVGNSLPGFEGAAQAGCEPENPLKTAGKSTVSAVLGGLSPSTKYHLRLSASNGGGTDSKEAAATFTTQGPIPAPTVLTTDDASELSYRDAKATGEVQRPAGADPSLNTSCRFEYVTDEQFTENVGNSLPGFEGATPVPCAETPLASPTRVTADLAFLRSGVTYHLRLAAEDAGGTVTKDAASTFTTIPGGDPTFSLDPNAVTGYTTLELFGTAAYGIGAEEEGLQYAFEYAEVGTENWSGCCGTIQTVPQVAAPRNLSYRFHELKPGTEYKFRLVLIRGYSAQEITPAPYPTATTRPQVAPTATIDPVTGVTTTTAHFSGTVNTNAPPGPLDAETKAAYAAHWHFECTPECPGLPGGTVLAEEGSETVSETAARLHANTYYDEVKLVVTSESFGATAGPETFQTPLVLPTVEAADGGSDGEGGYIIQGIVNSNNTKITDCRFEYGTTATYPNTYQAQCLPSPSGPDEVQQVNVEATEGQFKLSFRGQTTTDLAYNATPAEVQSALRALSSIGASGVTVSGAPQAYEVTFGGGALGGANVGPLKFSDGTTPLAGGGGVSVSTTTEGGTDHPVLFEAHVEHLTIGATYHFRVFATNAVGTESSSDRIFIPTLAVKSTCKNEQLRKENSSEGLPECRAYEMVSPPDKGGLGANLVDFAREGAVRYTSSASNIANSGSGQYEARYNSYVSVRGDSGWETLANLNGPNGSMASPPESITDAFPYLLFYSSDLRSSIWGGTPAGEQTSVLHRNPDGSFVPVGTYKEGASLPFGPSPGLFVQVQVAASSDLSHLVFNGTAGGEFGEPWGPGVYEFVGTGGDQPSRVDLDNSGAPISTCLFDGGHHYSASGNTISENGRVVVFEVAGGCGGANPPADEVWARVDGTTSYDVSASRCTRTAADPGGACNAPANAVFKGATPSGSRVFFTTTQQLVNGDTDQTNDLYACDIPAGSPAPTGLANQCSDLIEISGSSSEAKVEEVVASSEDGSTVYFIANGILADNEDALGQPAVAGDHNLYVWRQDAAHPSGQTTFVGRLESNDVNSANNRAQLTPDGRYLLFTTATPLVPTDSDNARDVYRYDADTAQLIRVSTGVSGAGGNGDGFDATTAEVTEQQSHPSISDDGEKIVFTTSEALSPLDGNNASDAYLWSAGHVLGVVGIDASKAFIDGSGKDIYFETGLQLSPSDGDSATDVYDARLEGGFSTPSVTRCAGESCQPPIAAPPNRAPSSEHAGAGNPPPPKACPKGKVKEKGKCVKKPAKKHHRKKSHKKSGSNGGGRK